MHNTSKIEGEELRGRGDAYWVKIISEGEFSYVCVPTRYFFNFCSILGQISYPSNLCLSVQHFLNPLPLNQLEVYLWNPLNVTEILPQTIL